MRFIKAHAYGNDFLYVEASAAPAADLSELARQMCDRHRGIGADGLIVYEPRPRGAAMRLINSDGSHAEVSGNGVRGLAALLLLRNRRADAAIEIDTEAGTKALTRLGREGARQTFRSAMGAPRQIRRESIPVGDRLLDAIVLDMGNPQCVVVGELPTDGEFRRLGPALEQHPVFPAGTNVEFAQADARDRVSILIWERGAGPTLSSGTGSCAALVAAAHTGATGRTADVTAPGGTQRVEWLEDGVYLTGWAEVVCEGEWLKTVPTGPAQI